MLGLLEFIADYINCRFMLQYIFPTEE